MSLLFLDPCVAYKPAILSFDPSSTMDTSLYKDFTVSRGLNYHYYHSAPQDGKPVLFLLHGFPSTSKDWREQVAFFKKEGYGLIVPDMLGYSGTASPKDPNDYRVSLIVKDLADLLDAEKVDKAIVIGHDWGAKIAGRFANYYPDRSIATIFLAVGYQPPSTDNTYEQFLEMSKKMFGYELFGYWRFFSEPDGPKLVEDHIDSFLSLLYAKDRTLGSVHFSPLGALRAWLSEDKTTPTAGYISAEEIELHKQDLLKAGFEGPSCYYKIHTLGIDAEDNKGVPPQNVKLAQPTFFGGCKNDQVARADLQKPIMEAYCSNLTYREFDAGHWVLWEAKDAVNEELLKWIQAL